MEARADPAEGSKSGLLEFRTSFSDKGKCSRQVCDGEGGTWDPMISILDGKSRSSQEGGKEEERRKDTRKKEGGKEGSFFQGAAAPIKL